MVHQQFKLVRPFTVARKRAARQSARQLRAGRSRDRAPDQDAKPPSSASRSIPDSRVDELSIAERQRVEIIKVLLGGARILILDEPTAVLTDEEAVRLLTTVRALAAGGAAVVLVTHKLGEVTAFTDRVTVMRNGRAVALLDSRSTTAQPN